MGRKPAGGAGRRDRGSPSAPPLSRRGPRATPDKPQERPPALRLVASRAVVATSFPPPGATFDLWVVRVPSDRPAPDPGARPSPPAGGEPAAAGDGREAALAADLARLGPGVVLCASDAPSRAFAERLAAAAAAAGNPTEIRAVPASGELSAAAGTALGRGAGGAESDRTMVDRKMGRSEQTPRQSGAARVLIAPWSLSRRTVARLLGLGEAGEKALVLEPGRVSLLRFESGRFRLVHHNVHDPKSLGALDEGLGRPA